MRKPALTVVMTALILSALALPAAAATVQLKIRQPYQASQDEGNLSAVRGVARISQDDTHAGTDINLYDSDGRRSFIGFVPKTNEYLFPDLASLDGKAVVLWGVIEIYQSLPATQLLNPDQVRPVAGR